MKSNPYHIMSGHYLLVAITVLVVATAALVLGSQNISRWVVSGGGGQSAGGGYTLNGTIGQAEAGPTIGGGDYTLSGGFWGGVTTTVSNIYLPFIQH